MAAWGSSSEDWWEALVQPLEPVLGRFRRLWDVDESQTWPCLPAFSAADSLPARLPPPCVDVKLP